MSACLVAVIEDLTLELLLLQTYMILHECVSGYRY